MNNEQEQSETTLVSSRESGLSKRSSELIRRGLDSLSKQRSGVTPLSNQIDFDEVIYAKAKSYFDARQSDISRPDVVHKWQTEEQSLSGGVWTILVQAYRYKGEEIMGWGWVPMHEPDSPTATATFHKEAATNILRTLYSAFTALHDPDDYLKQAGFAWVVGSTAAPKIATVGSAQDYGSANVLVDWSGESRYSVFTIRPPDTTAIKVVLGIESVAHILQLTTEAFRSLDWPIPP